MRGRWMAWALAGLWALPAGAQTRDQVAYGTRAGMQVEVVAREGIDTDHAVVRVVHTMADARAFCELYVQDPSEACVTATMDDVAARIRDRIEGDCVTGSFIGLWGSEFRFLGPLDPPTDLGAVWDFREAGIDGPLDGSTASGYDVVLDQFRAICPGRLHEGRQRATGKSARNPGLRSQRPAHITTPR